jgi:hypothetical protein
MKDFKILALSLEIEYNIRIAHDIIGCLLKRPLTLVEAEMIIAIAFCTKIQLTRREILGVKAALEYRNKELNLNLEFKDCMIEKERILRERELLNEGKITEPQITTRVFS